MNVLIVGKGGREAALAHKISLSSLANKVFVLPGNAAMNLVNSKISVHQEDPLEFSKQHSIDLCVIGPEAELASGLADKLRALGIPTVGPSKKATQLESSKIFCKKMMKSADIPTADFVSFTTSQEAIDWINSSDWADFVVKVDGLASGKGVAVCDDKISAKTAIKKFMEQAILGFNAKEVLIERKLIGKEVSAFALCSGETFIDLGTACDYKRLKDKDIGPNTGGMGCYSPAYWLTPSDHEFISKRIFKPLLKVMSDQDIPFNGFLFAGLMKTDQGIQVLEFNTRMGDPETQTLFPLIESDLLPFLDSCAHHNLHSSELRLKPLKSIHVVMASHGYPGTEGVSVRKGDVITGLSSLENCLFYPAAIKKKDSQYLTDGGRVLGLTVVAESFAHARQQVYQKVNDLFFEGAQFRTDIAKEAE